MINNKSFCVLPFIHLAADPDGSVKPCCISFDKIKKADGTDYNLGYDSIADIYNSSDFIEIRRKMIEGEIVEGCSDCYEQEKHSGFSQRINWNDKWNHPQINHQIEQIITNNYNSDLQVRYVDLRLGNMCNLKCRSCNTTNSSQLARELTDIAETNQKIYWFLPPKKVDSTWFTTPEFHKNLQLIKDSIYVAYMTGGEPTLIPENIEYLQSIVDNNRAHEVIITLNTNLTNAKPEFLEILSKFKEVIITASIDGYDDMQEYLRAPSKYKQVRKNLLAFAALPNVKIEVAPVIQATNINLITDLFDDLLSIKKSNIKLYPIVLLNPKHLSITILPQEFKKKTREQIVNWMNENTVPNSEFQLKMDQALSMLQEPDNVNQKTELTGFKEFTRIFDTHRGVSLVSVNPELAKAINYV